MFLATVLIVAHAAMAHVHHQDSVNDPHMQHAGHSHGEDSNEINDIFMHFVHNDEKSLAPISKKSECKLLITFLHSLSTELHCEKQIIPPLLYWEKCFDFTAESGYLSLSGLRAPPRI